MVEALAPHAGVDLGEADRWYVLVLAGGRPVASVRLPGPGRTTDPALVDAVLLPWADEATTWLGAREVLRRRLGVGTPASPASATVSVAVCTHGRPESLRRLLDGLRALDPAPDEVLVVDNDPHGGDCRAEAAAAGARYVAQPAQGLNKARHAAACAATGEFLAYIDDDCVPPPDWLRQLPERFADPSVGAVTGPAFGYVLDTPARVRRDEVAGFVLGVERRSADWLHFAPVRSGALGAGANMIFRRTALSDLKEPFPPELDAGTPTAGGGDLWVLSRLLACGWRVVYDPDTFVFHDHAPGGDALRATLAGYGRGSTAYLVRTALEARDPGTVRVWWWLWSVWLDTVVATLSGSGDPSLTALRWRYARGGLAGFGAWRRSRALNGTSQGPVPAPPDPLPDPAAAEAPPGAPTLTVVVSAPGASAQLQACLRALAGADVVVVDRGSRSTVRPLAGVEALHVPDANHATAWLAGAERATGDVVLLWDPTLLAGPGTLAAHRAAHAEAGDRLVLGATSARPDGRGLAALHRTLWWRDHQFAASVTLTPTFADLRGGNVSVRREALLAAGPISRVLDSGRDQWALALRLLEAGATVTRAPGAAATRVVGSDTRSLLTGAARAGAADAALLRYEPRMVVATPAARRLPLRVRALAAVLPVDAAETALHLLEAARMRQWWVGLTTLTSLAAYHRALTRAGGAACAASARAQATVVLELGRPDALPVPRHAAPILDVRHRGRRVTTLVPEHGQWHPGVAEQLLGRTRDAWRHERGDGWWRPLAGSFQDAGPVGSATVLLGPGRRPVDEARADELEAAGIRVERVGTARAGAADEAHWAAIDAAARAATADLVVVPLPGVTVGRDWVSAALPASHGERVALVLGTGLEEQEPPGPMRLVGDHPPRPAYAPIGSPAQCIAVVPRHLEALGGFDPSTARLSSVAPLLDLTERARAAGLVVAHREAPGLLPAGAYGSERRAGEWRRWHARGALIARDAIELGPAAGAAHIAGPGFMPFVQAVRRRFRDGTPSGRHIAGTFAAFLAGTASTLVSRASRGTARPRGSSAAPS